MRIVGGQLVVRAHRPDVASDVLAGPATTVEESNPEDVVVSFETVAQLGGRDVRTSLSTRHQSTRLQPGDALGRREAVARENEDNQVVFFDLGVEPELDEVTHIPIFTSCFVAEATRWQINAHLDMVETELVAKQVTEVCHIPLGAFQGISGRRVRLIPNEERNLAFGGKWLQAILRCRYWLLQSLHLRLNLRNLRRIFFQLRVEILSR
mmetsp:Transcript_7778/g.23781  ORF Transcript_7778/g.23781 Transcript_7778/m.23781 type:complete len:209 (-) Transcript_7778:76-702(-)